MKIPLDPPFSKGEVVRRPTLLCEWETLNSKWGDVFLSGGCYLAQDSNMNLYPSALFVLLLAVFGSAHAEVMDKEPALIENILWGLVSSVLCLFAARFKPWLLLVVVPLPALYFLNLVSEIRDPFVGPAILKEAGEFYIYSGYGLGILILASILVGLGWSVVKVRHNKPLEPT